MKKRFLSILALVTALWGCTCTAYITYSSDIDANDKENMVEDIYNSNTNSFAEDNITSESAIIVDNLNNSTNNEITANNDISEGSNEESDVILEPSIVEGDLDNNDIDMILKAYSMMEKAEFSSYNYKWEKESYAAKPNFTDGVLSGKIKDFDNDGKLELLILRIINSNNSKDYSVEYAKAVMEIYEIKDNDVQLNSNTEEFTVIDNMTDAGGLECFIKGNYIVLECATQNNTFADGATQNINIYSYNGDEFISEFDCKFSGSILRFTDDNSMAEQFKRLGFTKTSSHFENEMISPYFIMCGVDSSEWDFSDCTNLAKIEDNIEPVFELLITNNIGKLLNESSDITDWNKYFIENGVMNIEINDYFDMEYWR